MTNVHYLLTCLQYDPVYFEQMNLPGASFDDGGACLLTTSLGRAYSGQQIIYGVVLLLLVISLLVLLYTLRDRTKKNGS